MIPVDAIERMKLEARCLSGARWFYWIAALSLITSIISLSGSRFGFIVSLGVTQLVDGLANGAASGGSSAPKVVAIVFDVMAVGLFALVGYFASKRLAWVFIAGMAIYLLDGLIFLLVRDWLGIAFHAFVLYSIFGGYQACVKLNALEREGSMSTSAQDAPR
ncbi:MAG: hypothetical protein WCD76_14875 [Pyrinomonadaceae bacterium]